MIEHRHVLIITIMPFSDDIVFHILERIFINQNILFFILGVIISSDEGESKRKCFDKQRLKLIQNLKVIFIVPNEIFGIGLERSTENHSHT